MKAKIFFFIMIAGIILSCNPQKKSPIEGVWQLVYANYPSMDLSYPGQIIGSDVKAWTDGCFTFAGSFQVDTLKMVNFGWGTYKLTDGNHYEESIIKHNVAPKAEGTNIKMLLEIRNDTLIQRWPADEQWNLQQNYSTEKYVHLK